MRKLFSPHIKKYILTACSAWTGGVSFLFTIFPNLVECCRWWILGGTFAIAGVVLLVWMRYHTKVVIHNDNYTVSVEYGDLFDVGDCKVVIPFDECFTTTVGSNPGDINPPSLCGQFLQKHPGFNQKTIRKLITVAGLSPSQEKSEFGGKTRYESGRLLLYEDKFLLLAFAKLKKNGRGELTFEEYCESLSVLWSEIDKYYGQLDVCIPVIGTGTTRIGDGNISNQELLDVLIGSYIVSRKKIKSCASLRIICRREDDINIDKILFG